MGLEEIKRLYTGKEEKLYYFILMLDMVKGVCDDFKSYGTSFLDEIEQLEVLEDYGLVKIKEKIDPKEGIITLAKITRNGRELYKQIKQDNLFKKLEELLDDE
mgnify:CR=1 FL=1